jgi:hypothetical protein
VPLVKKNAKGETIYDHRNDYKDYTEHDMVLFVTAVSVFVETTLIVAATNNY